MEAIFLVRDDFSRLKNVYGQKLQNMWEQCQSIYTKKDVIIKKEECENTKYIFSSWHMPEFSEDEIKEYFPSLEAIFYAAGSVKYFAKPFLKQGIKVFSAAAANSIPVAEFTVSQILLANKGYFQAVRAYKNTLCRNPYYLARKFADNKYGNYNAKIGIIGFGAVGREVVKMLQNYKLEVLVADPYVSENEMKKFGDIKKVELHELFKECDVISNHLPDIPNTKGILSYQYFNEMKKTSTFINTGRGAQVIERDLVKALREQPNRCALLDVTNPEPIKLFSPLNRMTNVFISPHLAGSRNEEEKRLGEYMVQAYIDYKNGRHNSCEVTLDMLNTRA